MLKETKTQKSKWTISICKDVINKLKVHKKQQNEQKLFLGPYNDKENPDGYYDDDLVFCNNNGKPLSPDHFTRHFQAYLEKAGLPKMRFHDGRLPLLPWPWKVAWS